MTPALVAFACSFGFVSLKAFQSRNIVLDRDRWVLPMALLIAPCEAGVILSVAAGRDWLTVLAMGLGGGLGALGAMRIHRRMFRGEV